MAPQDLQFAPGQLVGGRYRIVGLLGRGGMGSVYRADDLRLGVPIALKFLSPQLAGDGDAIERLRGEVRIARQVSHPNVCRVHDLDAAQGQHFLTMEYVDGEDLAVLLGRIGRLPADKAVDVARQLAAGLQAAHERGVVHRDLKPGNVMLDGRGRVRITDFGLAIRPGAAPAGLAGTPAYLAPELVLGGPATARSDVYALGLVLFEVFTGRPPFTATTLSDWLHVHREVAPPRPSSLVPDLAPQVEQAILACLAKDPAARPAAAGELLHLLPGGDSLAAAVAAGETPAPELVAEAESCRALSPGRVGLLLAALVAVVALLLCGSRANLDARLPFGPSVEVLGDRAQQLLAALGGETPAADRASGFGFDPAYLEWEEDPRRGNARWERLGRGQPLTWYFWYRQSPTPLEPGNGWSGGQVTLQDPPATLAGMSHVITDVAGRLVEFRTVPTASNVDAATSRPAVDWQVLFRAAGLDATAFVRTPPARTPPDFADERCAWLGTLADQDLPIRIEAAALAGRPVYFRVVAPWEFAAGHGPEANLVQAGAFAFCLLLCILLGAGLLVRNNLRAGRGDRRGALRLACFQGGIAATSELLASDLPMTATGFMRFVLLPLHGALLAGTLAWTLYLALEPAVRRSQPHMLVGWVRLLAGRVRDAAVGRELLFGTLLGLCGSAACQFGGWLKVWTDHELPPNHFARLESLGALRKVVAAVVNQGSFASLVALATLALFVLLRRLSTRPGRAEAALLLSMVALFWAAGVQSWPMVAATILGNALLVFALVHLGLLAGAVCFLVQALTTYLPLQANADLPQAPLTFASLSVVALLGVVGAIGGLSTRARA